MIKINDKSNCCGCTACEASCGVHAIKMIPDIQGFKYPIVDVSKCIDCGLCENVCPFINPQIPDIQSLQKIYGVRLKNEEDLRKSQSGGAFMAIAEWGITNGFKIYGVVLDEFLKVRHRSATTMEEIFCFRGSKYVQSDLDGIFREIISRLKKNDKILFVGTGCQVAGLINLCKTLKINQKNLITIDLICYGVPSPKYWEDYLNWMEKKYGAKIISANFRDKEKGWSNSQNSLILENGRKVFPYENFYQPLLFRRSCNKCHFTNFNRKSDITIGDFWGIDKVKPEYSIDNKGVSLVLLNTETGKLLFESIKVNLLYFETTKEMCAQPQLLRPQPIFQSKEDWELLYEKYGYNVAIKKIGLYNKPYLIRIIAGKLKRFILNSK